MTEEGDNKKNKIMLISVVVAFLSPIVLSWFVFNHTDFTKLRGTSNHGELILPPRPLADLALIDPFQEDRKESLHGKWSMFYISDKCDERCMDNVYRMRQLHSTMDKHSLRVQKVLLLTRQEVSEVKSLLTDYVGQQVVNTTLIDTNALLEKFRLTNSDQPIKDGRLFIIDPLGNLMMYFEGDANPREIMDDLKQLLRASRIG